MVKVTSDESFCCNTVIVAEPTGCFEMVSNTIPFTLPVFCERATEEATAKAKINKVLLINLKVLPAGYGE